MWILILNFCLNIQYSWFWCWMYFELLNIIDIDFLSKFQEFDFKIDCRWNISIFLILVLIFHWIYFHFFNLFVIDIDFYKISRILILKLIVDQTIQEYWYWNWMLTEHFKNFYIDPDFPLPFQEFCSWYWRNISRILISIMIWAQWIPVVWTYPCSFNPLLISAHKRLTVKVY